MNSNIKIIRSAISSLPSVSIIKFLKEKGFYIIGCEVTENSAARFFLNDFFLVDKSTPDTQKKVIQQYTSALKKHEAKWILSGPENKVFFTRRIRNVITDNHILSSCKICIRYYHR